MSPSWPRARRPPLPPLRHRRPAPPSTGSVCRTTTTGTGAWHLPPATASFWWGMAYLVLLCTVFAFFAQNHAASRTSPSRVSLLMGSEPVFGALIAVWGFGERVGPGGWIGGAMIVAAAWWVTLPPRRA
ncbi:DMT family transporter [Variovorax paradoxus]|uniref:DMT family transporter n=1 Tax=Variovorax paradoxus TaxID=34073 RepID=UPI0038D1C0AE